MVVSTIRMRKKRNKLICSCDLSSVEVNKAELNKVINKFPMSPCALVG